MNDVPMRFDYSKTINEQLTTFNYYKDRYACYELEIIKLRQENQELKKQLENANEQVDYLRRSIERKESTIIDLEQERVPYTNEYVEKLKKQLEEYKHHLNCAKEMLELQGQDGNYNYDSYMLGVYNGMEYIISLFETREPIYRDGKDIEFLSNKNQQKEFIGYISSYIELLNNNPDLLEESQKDLLEEILSKYKEIIGVEDE